MFSQTLWIFFTYFMIFTAHIWSTEHYTVEIPTEILTISTSSRALGINDEDDILICHTVQGTHKYSIWSKKNSLLEITKERSFSIEKFKNGNAIGFIYDFKMNKFFPAFWNKGTGLQKIELKIPHSTTNIPHAISPNLIDVRGSGHYIGRYSSEDGKDCCFTGYKETVEDFNINDELHTCGYQVMNVDLKQINSRGSIYGSFDYGYKHPLKDSWVREGTKNFFFNGNITIMDLPPNSTLIGLNNNDEILFSCRDSKTSQIYLWSCDKKFKPILNDYNDNGCYTPFNDLGQIIVQANTLPFEFFVLNPDKSLINLNDSLKNSGIAISHFSSINNNGVILGQGYIWGESHVFILRPVKN